MNATKSFKLYSRPHSLKSFKPKKGLQIVSQNGNQTVLSVPQSDVDKQATLKLLLENVKHKGSTACRNVVAFSGGVDSSLCAYLVQQTWPSSAVAVIGVSPSLSQFQLERARFVANHIGISLKEVQTKEGQLDEYVANAGDACFYCKTTMYQTLKQIDQYLNNSIEYGFENIVLYNGTNADDLKDPTRLGLIAARNYRVESPLAILPKEGVRAIAKYVGLPNWDWAASPCLRSRLEIGLEATPENLALVELAEDSVRELLQLKSSDSFRVRLMLSGEAVLELQSERLEQAQQRIFELQQLLGQYRVVGVSLRVFQSGSLAQVLQVGDLQQYQ